MITKGWCRKLINAQLRRVKRVFKWGVRKELVPPGIYHGAQCIEGLRRFRSAAKESADVLPVPAADVTKALPKMLRTVAAMVQLQLLTGMRVSEVLEMRSAEVDRSGKVWLYTPARHKTLHFGRKRSVPLGPKAQELLAPFLLLDPQAPLFSPKRAEAERHAEQRKRRESKETPSQKARRERARQRRGGWQPGSLYTVAAYRRAIARACDAAGVTRWNPARLRHNAAETFRKEFGVEVARCVLGHSDVRTTELYSSFDVAKAVDAAGKLG